MPKNINSASRLVALLQNATNLQGNLQTLEIWALLFKINEANHHKKSILVVERLGAMYREIDLVRDQMQEAKYSEALYVPALSRLENALSTMLLPNTWQTVSQYLTPETFVALSFCGEILPNEELLISPDDLASIEVQVQELEDLLTTSTIPPSLRALIAHHITIIRKALAEYPIAGAKALREAGRAVVGDFVEAHEKIKSHRDSPEVTKLSDVWKRVNDAASIALKTEKIAQLGQKVWEAIGIIF
jgi:hypothetical protein